MTDGSISQQAFDQASAEVMAAFKMLRAGLQTQTTPELEAMWEQVSARPITVQSLKLLHAHYYRWHYEKMGGEGEPMDFPLEPYEEDYRATAAYFRHRSTLRAPPVAPPGLPYQKSKSGVAMVAIVALTILLTGIALFAR